MTSVHATSLSALEPTSPARLKNRSSSTLRCTQYFGSCLASNVPTLARYFLAPIPTQSWHRLALQSSKWNISAEGQGSFLQRMHAMLSGYIVKPSFLRTGGQCKKASRMAQWHISSQRMKRQGGILLRPAQDQGRRIHLGDATRPTNCQLGCGEALKLKCPIFAENLSFCWLPSDIRPFCQRGSSNEVAPFVSLPRMIQNPGV